MASAAGSAHNRWHPRKSHDPNAIHDMPEAAARAMTDMQTRTASWYDVVPGCRSCLRVGHGVRGRLGHVVNSIGIV